MNWMPTGFYSLELKIGNIGRFSARQQYFNTDDKRRKYRYTISLISKFFVNQCTVYLNTLLHSIMANIWPSAPVVVTDQVKQIITRFFDISDSIDPTSGRLFAEEIFVKDGIFKTHKTCIFKGHDGTSRFSISPQSAINAPISNSLI
jgi:hypothetical protein